VSLWGGVKGALGDIGSNAMPRLRSGLRLQSCGAGGKKPGYRIEDCTPERKEILLTAVQQAQAWVNNALSKVDTVLADPAHADSHVLFQLYRHFRIKNVTTSLDDVKKVRQGLAKIQAAFGGEIPFQCETNCSAETVAETPFWPLVVVRIAGDIHLCPPFFDDRQVDPPERAATVIHEMAHKYGDKPEGPYYKRQMKAYLMLSKDEALDVADTYAQFARYVQ
jgi:hypothetical protein